MNADHEQIKVNESAWFEWDKFFSWQHPLKSFNGTSICLLNIRSWNAYLEHFLSGNICQSYSSLFCFTETNINDSPVKHICEVLDDWKDIHNNTQHGLALYYKVSKVNIIEVIDIPSTIEIFQIVLEIKKETFLLVMLSWAPGPVGSFIDQFILLMNELPIQHRILIVGDFIFDQMLPKNVANTAPLIQSFDVSAFTIFNSCTRGNIGSCICFFQFQYCFSSTFTLQWSLCSFSTDLMARYDLNLHCQH